MELPYACGLSPSIRLNIVLLPDPFGPKSVYDSPRRIFHVKFERIVRLPYRTNTFFICTRWGTWIGCAFKESGKQLWEGEAFAVPADLRHRVFRIISERPSAALI